jgi:hypothetical protein
MLEFRGDFWVCHREIAKPLNGGKILTVIGAIIRYNCIDDREIQ